MNMNPLITATLALTVLLAVGGCNKKADVNSELDRAVKAVAAEPVGQPAQASAPTPTVPLPALHVQQAQTAFKAGNYNDAVTQIHTVLVQGASGKMSLTPQQYMAVQDAAGAMLNDLYVRASKGDANAKQAVKQYERLMHSR